MNERFRINSSRTNHAIEVYHHGSIFAGLHTRLEAEDGFIEMALLGHSSMIEAHILANMYNEAWPIEFFDEENTTEKPNEPDSPNI